MDLGVPRVPPTDPDMHNIVIGGSECVSEWAVSVCDPSTTGTDSSTPSEADLEYQQENAWMLVTDVF